MIHLILYRVASSCSCLTATSPSLLMKQNIKSCADCQENRLRRDEREKRTETRHQTHFNSLFLERVQARDDNHMMSFWWLLLTITLLLLKYSTDKDVVCREWDVQEMSHFEGEKRERNGRMDPVPETIREEGKSIWCQSLGIPCLSYSYHQSFVSFMNASDCSTTEV